MQASSLVCVPTSGSNGDNCTVWRSQPGLSLVRGCCANGRGIKKVPSPVRTHEVLERSAERSR